MSWSSKFEEAAWVLEHAETYEPLPKHPKLRAVARLWEYPTFTPWISWTVLTTHSGLFVRRLVWHKTQPSYGDLSLYGSEALLSPERWKLHLHDLGKLKIALAVEDRIGLDGTVYGLELIGSRNTIRTTWWLEPPPGSEELAQWHTRVTKEFQQYLPAMTNPYQM